MDLARAIALDISEHGIAGGATSWTRDEAGTAAVLDWTLVSSFADFEALEGDWSELHQRVTPPAGRVFLSYNWNWHWCRHFLTGDGIRLAVAVGRHNGKVVSIWPMVTQRRAGLRVATFMGMPVSQYGEVIIDRKDPRSGAWIKQGWQFVRNKMGADLVLLRKVRDDSAAGALMRELGVPRDNQQRAPYIDLTGETSFEGFDQRYSGKDRKNRRRKRRRLEETGTVGCHRVAGPTARVQAVALAMDRKRDWLRSVGLVSTAVTDPRFDAFFRDAASSTGRPAGCDVVELTVDGKCVATKVTVSDETYRGLHFTSYDPAAEKFSPGILILETMLTDAIAEGITTFDFMAPAAPYKMEWTDKTVGIADYAVSTGLMGWLYQAVYLHIVRPRLQWLAKNGPEPIRRAIGAAWGLLSRHTKPPAGPND
jgi:CelD/BcsL family acetyltransferase involved in cellulose biosynthesis